MHTPFFSHRLRSYAVLEALRACSRNYKDNDLNVHFLLCHVCPISIVDYLLIPPHLLTSNFLCLIHRAYNLPFLFSSLEQKVHDPSSYVQHFLCHLLSHCMDTGIASFFISWSVAA